MLILDIENMAVSDVRPNFTDNDVSDEDVGYTKLRGKLPMGYSTSRVKSANFNNLSGSEFSPAVGLPACKTFGMSLCAMSIPPSQSLWM